MTHFNNKTVIESLNYRLAKECSAECDAELFLLEAIDALVLNGEISRGQAEEITFLIFGHASEG